jgi:hypothetical protein
MMRLYHNAIDQLRTEIATNRRRHKRVSHKRRELKRLVAKQIKSELGFWAWVRGIFW